jgi:hypothetical protein
MRHKNVNWNLPEGQKSPTGSTHQHENIDHALLMDLRDEMQEQNRLTEQLIRLMARMDRRLAVYAKLKGPR